MVACEIGRRGGISSQSKGALSKQTNKRNSVVCVVVGV